MKQKNSAIISRSALLSNYAAVDAVLDASCASSNRRKPKIICVVKADAYGHGISAVSSALGEAGCDFFAVSSEDEAIELRALELRCGRRPQILILGHVMPENVDELIENDITCALVSADNARELSEAVSARNRRGTKLRRGGDALKVHIKLDTGMNRVGYPTDPDRLESTLCGIAEAAADPNLSIKGIFTHFACADDEWMDGRILSGYEDCGGYSALQLGRYRAAVDGLTKRGIDVGLKHCANSAAALCHPEAYFDAVRAGVILYGLMPDGSEDPRFRPVMRFDSTVVHLHRLDPGDKVSYGAEFTASRPTLVATVGAGYADGFERAYRGCDVWIGGRPYRQIGRICMDQFMADVTAPSDDDPAPPAAPVSVGDPVTLFGGDNGASTNALARRAGTINYEVVCKVSKRVPRIVE